MPEAVQLRPARADEVATVAAILRAAAEALERKGMALWGTGDFGEDAVKEHVREGRYHLALVDGEPAGVFRLDAADAVFWPEIPDAASLFLHKLAVHPRRQGQGLADVLLAHACDIAAARGHAFLRLDCRGGRPKLRALYEDFGFRDAGDVTLGGRVFHRFAHDLTRSARTTAPTAPPP